MSISGIDRVTYGVEDLEAAKKFFSDWGLKLVREGDGGLDFETLSGGEIFVRKMDDPALPPAIEEGSTLRQIIWSTDTQDELDACRNVLARQPGFYEKDGTIGCTDPVGVGIAVRVSRQHPVEVKGAPANTYDNPVRIDTPTPGYERAEPAEIGHVVFFTDKLDEATAFYEELGFKMSDRYPGRGHFMRTRARGGHHNLFYLKLPNGKPGLNHVAFKVRDIHEVFGGGMNMARAGWKTQLGPGKHPISSAFFWYFYNPCGGLVEYYADEDILTENWKPRDFEPSLSVLTEWAINGGIDGNTRRQARGGEKPSGQFITERD